MACNSLIPDGLHANIPPPIIVGNGLQLADSGWDTAESSPAGLVGGG
jgi:hypothetical protein